MGIIKNNKNIIAIYRGDKKITSVFKNNLRIFGESEPPQYNYKNATLTSYSDNEKVKLCDSTRLFDSIYIYEDDVTINPTETKEYTFATRGEHQVGYAIKKGITDFSYAFANCYNLTNISDDFLADNTEIVSLNYAFNGTRLSTIKKELVSPLKELSSVTRTFANNGYLQNVAFDLFADNYKIDIFESTFENCYNWYGQCPIDNGGEKLFVRSDGNDGYRVPYNTTNCFLSCGSSDMSIIPSTWGGNKSEALVIEYTQNSGNIPITNHIEYFKLVKFPDENGGQVLYDSTINGEQSGAYFAEIVDINTVEFYFKDGITDLTDTFSNNPYLTKIKSNINLPNLQRVVNMFRECTVLTEISEKLFEKCKNILYFDGCFYNCYGITSYAPKDDDDTGIYNRLSDSNMSGKEGYQIPYGVSGCFYNCVNMQDYSQISYYMWTS